WSRDDRHLSGTSVLVTTNGTPDNPVGTSQHVNVELGVNFQCRQDGNIQLVNHRTLVVRVGVPGTVNFDLASVGLHARRGTLVEVLDVHNLLNQAFFKQLDDW